MRNKQKHRIVREIKQVLERHLVPKTMIDDLFKEVKRVARLPEK